MAQTMIFEGKNLDDWFKLPMVKEISKTNKGITLYLYHYVDGLNIPAPLHIGDTLEINDKGAYKIIRGKHGNNTNIRA